jgi:predicted ArsR family transcriptional regulator
MDRFDALGDPALRRTALFVRGEGRPVTTDEVAAGLGIPRSAARWRLEKLLAAGMLVAAYERRTGRTGPGAGRPAKTYAAAVETTAVEFPRRRYETLLRLLIGVVPGRNRATNLRDVGERFGAELAQAAALRRAPTVRSGPERVCRALGRLGFQASVESAGATEATIVSATCPLRPLVVAEPEARAIDQAMWQSLFATAVGDDAAGIVCRTHDCLDGEGPCRIVVSFASRA